MEQWLTLLSWPLKWLRTVTSAMKLKDTYLLLGRKAMINQDSVLKSRDITWPRKVRPLKAMVFPVLMYGCENCTVKKAESQRTEAVGLWSWSRCLRVPPTARRLEELMLTLKFQYFGHLMQKTDLMEKTLMLERTKCRRNKKTTENEISR